MKKLKYILQSKYLFKILAFIFLTGTLLFTNIHTYKSKYTGEETSFIGIVTKYELTENKLTIQLKSKENLIVNYKYKDKKFNNLSYGDKILVEGTLQKPSSVNIPNTFNYKKYLYNKKIYYIVEASSIEKIENNKNYLYTVKNILYKRINNLKSLLKFSKETYIGINLNKFDSSVTLFKMGKFLTNFTYNKGSYVVESELVSKYGVKTSDLDRVAYVLGNAYINDSNKRPVYKNDGYETYKELIKKKQEELIKQGREKEAAEIGDNASSDSSALILVSKGKLSAISFILGTACLKND